MKELFGIELRSNESDKETKNENEEKQNSQGTSEQSKEYISKPKPKQSINFDFDDDDILGGLDDGFKPTLKPSPKKNVRFQVPTYFFINISYMMHI